MDLMNIQNLIYEIRGKRVMLDFDLAGMYEVETRVLNQSVKRNGSVSNRLIRNCKALCFNIFKLQIN